MIFNLVVLGLNPLKTMVLQSDEDLAKISQKILFFSSLRDSKRDEGCCSSDVEELGVLLKKVKILPIF